MEREAERTITGLRKDLGLSREEYAKRIEVKKSSLDRYEQFKSIPDAEVAKRIMKLSKITDVFAIKWSK